MATAERQSTTVCWPVVPAQSALSTQIRRLEELLGQRLLRRTAATECVAAVPVTFRSCTSPSIHSCVGCRRFR
ncbi:MULTISPECIES: LysR family transcriptional regulator [unclassified Pseudomonas]|uniref:LysR family transcriptional regulator n=1 Tax=unclassified Pseudomonas TaxID=196821 RepID=UPI0021141793